MSLEAVSRLITKREPCPEVVLLDLRRVNRVDSSGAEFSSALASFLDEQGGRLVFSSAHLLEPLIPPAIGFPNLDAALEWCEEELLFRIRGDSEPQAIPINRHELLQDLTAGELARLSPHLEAFNAEAGTLVVRAGEPAARIFLVTSGSLSVLLRAENQPDLRLSPACGHRTPHSPSSRVSAVRRIGPSYLRRTFRWRVLEVSKKQAKRPVRGPFRRWS